MIIVLKLITGTEVVGMVEDCGTPIHQLELITLHDPMYIVGYKDDSGYMTMRLNDAMLLSSDDYMVLSAKHVMTSYNPAPNLSEYYEKATVYAKKHLKPLLLGQIVSAVRDIDIAMKEAEEDITWEEYGNVTPINPSTTH